MSEGTLSRVSDRTAVAVCKRFDIGQEAQALLTPALTPRQYVELLGEKQYFVAAIRFLAHAMPKRESVWWACLCVRETAGPSPRPEAAAALQSAERWVANPTEDDRRAAMPAAQAAGLATGAGSAAMAAFVSGGSLGPPNVPPIQPAENLTSQLAAAAVLVCAVAREPEKAMENFRALLRKGIEVADGRHRWPEKR